MTAESQFYTLMSTAPGVTALVGTRIYPDALPEERALPAVVFVRQSTVPLVGIGGQRFGDDIELSVACWAETRLAADALASAVDAAIAGTVFSLSARDGGFDPETGLFASTLTLQAFISS